MIIFLKKFMTDIYSDLSQTTNESSIDENLTESGNKEKELIILWLVERSMTSSKCRKFITDLARLDLRSVNRCGWTKKIKSSSIWLKNSWQNLFNIFMPFSEFKARQRSDYINCERRRKINLRAEQVWMFFYFAIFLYFER